MQDDLLGPCEVVVDYDGVLLAVKNTRALWDAVVALKSQTGLDYEGGESVCGLDLFVVKC